MKKSKRTAALYARIHPMTKKWLKKLCPKDLCEAEFVEMILNAHVMLARKSPNVGQEK